MLYGYGGHSCDLRFYWSLDPVASWLPNLPPIRFSARRRVESVAKSWGRIFHRGSITHTVVELCPYPPQHSQLERGTRLHTGIAATTSDKTQT